MTHASLYKLKYSAHSRGFTLVEMLVVAAMIALFAGLAVFSIQSQYERDKQKAATAEARGIASSMHFAQQDLGFYPKLCFLRINTANMLQEIQNFAQKDRAVDYYSHSIGNIDSRIRRMWKSHYMTTNPDKVVRMTSPTFGGRYYDWPADPWDTPYVVYLVNTRTETPQGGGNPVPVHSFIRTPSEDPNFFAGVVSYGRNRVPGLTDPPINDQVVNTRRGERMFVQIDQLTYNLLTFDQLTPGHLDMILIDPTNPPQDGTAQPRIREEGSDDRFYEGF